MKTLILAALLFVIPVTANATVQVLDQTNTITNVQKSNIEATPSPHRVIVNFMNVGSQNELSANMNHCVTTPNTICIGVDPVHRWTSSQFGIDTGVRSVDFIQVSRAGNQDFKDSHWAEGVQSIISRANVLSTRTEKPAAVIVNQPVVEKPVPVWPFLVGFGLLGLGAHWVVRTIRKRQEKAQETLDDVRREAAELASTNINNMKWEKALENATRDYPTIPKAPPLKASLAEITKSKVSKPLPKVDIPVKKTSNNNKSNKNTYNVKSNNQKGGVTTGTVSPAPSSVTIVNNGNSNDFATGLVVGSLIADRPSHYCHNEPVHSHHSHSNDDDSYSSSGSSSSFSDSYSSGGDSSSFSSFDSGSSFSSGGDCSSF